MVSQGMAEFFPDLSWSDYYALGTNNLVGFATALGAQAIEITDAGQLPAALAAALTGSGEGVPQVISVKVDPTAAPPYYVPPSS